MCLNGVVYIPSFHVFNHDYELIWQQAKAYINMYI